ncbi:MAG: hypothetical protein AAGJ84_05915 [Pseudomonadota bacterium]
MSRARTPFFQGVVRGFHRTGRIQRYFLLLLCGAIGIGALAVLAMVSIPKSYSSGFTLILPGAGSNTTVNLERLGQASSNSASPFGDHTLSPTENYKKLLQSYRLRGEVAASLDMPLSEINPPNIKLINQTKLMYVSVKADDADISRLLADTWLTVFLDEVEALRSEEQELRESAYRDMLKRFQIEVEAAQARIIGFQSEYGLISIEQFQDLVGEGDRLSRAVDAANTEARVATREVSRLSSLLGLSPEDAARVMVLLSDPGFKSLRDRLNELETTLAEFANMYGQNHPERIALTEEVVALRSATNDRGTALIGFSAYRLMETHQQSANQERGRLIAALVESATKAAGAKARAAALSETLRKTQTEIESLAEPATELAALLRDHRVAETVFASALARIDTSRADRFASYPLTQTVERPDTPDTPSSPSAKFILIGAFAGLFLYAMGLGLLWIRLPLIRALLKTI